MPKFCVLASGSSGNAAFLQSGGFGLLIDAGLNPRLLGSRLATIGLSWRHVNAVLLTHVHTDHWKDRTLAQLRALSIPLYCHGGHQEYLAYGGLAFDTLRSAGLINTFTSDKPFALPGGLSCLPIAVPHDSDPTYAFRIDGPPGLFGDSWSLGYASDLGCVPPALVEAFRDVNTLAVEFNHDEDMERRSGRPRHLIARVLGDRGHLSNRQAAAYVRQIMEEGGARTLRHVIQLHLSRHCNLPGLAQAEAKRVLRDVGRPVGLTTATQDCPTKVIELEPELVR